MNLLFISDIVGNPGRRIITGSLDRLIDKFKADFVIVDGENASGGAGITVEIAESLLNKRIDVITLGNHAWKHKEIIDYIKKENRLIRPANLPDSTPGKPYFIKEVNNIRVAVFTLLGRIFMNDIIIPYCPFETAQKIIDGIKDKADVIIAEIHAEATSEKIAMGYFLDSKVSAVIGTHTHVQTADNRILSGKTAYITDAGMTGPLESVIGVDKDIIIKKFLTQMPARFEVAKGDAKLEGVIIRNVENNELRSIERVFELE